MIDILKYVSDLHLEINRNATALIEGEHVNVAVPPFLKGKKNEALVIDGDTIPTIFLQKKRTDKQSRQMQELFGLLCEQISGFGLIFFIMGNHESYHGYHTLSATFMRKYMYDVLGLDPKQFIVLDNDVYPLSEHTLLVGSTLWTDMRRDHPDAHQLVGRGMNDFRLIRNEMLPGWDDDKPSNIFSTYRAAEEHRKSREFIQRVANENSDKRIIVATHHAPSYQSNGRAYQNSLIIDGYCSDMEDFILMHQNISDWIHGHTHVNVEYKIGYTRVTSNMRGYCAHDESAERFTEKQFKEKYIEVT